MPWLMNMGFWDLVWFFMKMLSSFAVALTILSAIYYALRGVLGV